MPKRDDAYMSAQRDAIAQAAMACMLEKGLHGTSLRDICKAAGISIGALYIHFRTLEDVFVAACSLQKNEPKPIVTRWDEYVAQLRALKREVDDEESMRCFRLSLQFVAEMTQRRKNPPGLSEMYARDLGWLRTSLETMAKAGEIELPLGLDMTVETHQRLIMGTLYIGVANRDSDFDKAVEELVAAIAFTVGRTVERAAKPSATPRKKAAR